MDLLNSYDSYKDFSITGYFTTVYNLISSKVSLEIPLKPSLENFNKVYNFLDLQTHEFKVFKKSWHIEEFKTEKNNNDYPKYLILQSKTHPLLCEIDLSYENELEITFFFDVKDSKLEEFSLNQIKKLRDTFAEFQKSKFKILTFSGSSFQTEDISTKDFRSLDIKKHYNDDFLEVHQIISETIDSDTSGIVLLHGKPGTGKTSYIKSLISSKTSKDFIFIQNDFVNNLLSPSFVSFLIEHKNSILIIEDAEKVISSRENGTNSVVSTILQLTDGLFSDYLNIKIICTFNTDIDNIDTALMRKGRLIAKYEFKDLEASKTDKLLEEFGHETVSQSLSLAEIFHKNSKSFVKKENSTIGFNKD